MAVNNVLTEACTTASTSRPFWRKISYRQFVEGGDNLGLVWMVPLGLLPDPKQLPIEVIGALVQAIDHGYAIIIRADRADTVATVAGMVVAFTVGPFGAGGGRA